MRKRKNFILFWYMLAAFLILSFSVNASETEDQTVDMPITITPTPVPDPIVTQNGWVTTEAGKKYLVDGVAVTGLYEIKGKTYVFSKKGILQISKWSTVGDKKYCSDSKGVIVRDKLVKVKGYYYYVKADGGAVKDGWKTLPKGKSYFGFNGIRYVGIRKIGDKTYGFSQSGYLLLNRWIEKNGKYYRTDSNGVIIKDKVKKIENYYYCFSTSGARIEKQWKTFPKGKSYFGFHGRRASGDAKIGSKTYYFNSKGYLVTGKTTVTEGNNTYYLDGNGVVEMKMVKSGSSVKYYGTTGAEMSHVEWHHYLTLQKAKKVAAQVTNANMSQSQKLKAVFDWVVSKYYADYARWSNYEGWPADFADYHFDRGRGDCHADAAAFAYLARAIGYTQVYVCSDSVVAGAHSWAEIDGKVYDPLFWQAKGRQSKYYGGNYGRGGYELSPKHHTLIP